MIPEWFDEDRVMPQKKPPNIQRIPMRVFIPWDSQGRIYLDNYQFITRETQVKDRNIIMFPNGILLKGKK